MKEKISKFLNLYPEVRWDRYTDDGKELCFYGWINRTDNKYDYLELAFDHEGNEKWYSTSSKWMSASFAGRGGFKHHVCKRVEDLLGDTVNSIKINP
jgi:hypothetical protein